MNDLYQVYAKIKKSNTVSRDKISMNTLCKLKRSTQPIILNLANKIIESGIFPKELKVSRIIPIIKNGKVDRLEPSSYRPVNILSPV